MSYRVARRGKSGDDDSTKWTVAGDSAGLSIDRGVALTGKRFCRCTSSSRRYRAMVEDALSANRVFGMIQPFAPQQDNRPAARGAENQKQTGSLPKSVCAGYIEKMGKNYRKTGSL